MTKALAWLAANGTWIMPISLFVGLAWADLAALLRPALLPTVFIMLALLIMRVDSAAARRHLQKPAMPLLGLAWMLVGIPVVFAAGIYLAGPLLSSGLVLALVFWASAPPLFSTPGLAYLLRLDAALALGLMLAAVALHPIVTPFFASVFTDGATAISPLELGWRLLSLVGGATAIAFVVRHFAGERRLHALAPTFDGLNVVALVIFAIALMDGIGVRLWAEPVYALWFITFVMVLSFAVIALTTVLFWPAGRLAAATIGFSTGGRNIALVIGALGASVPEDTWLFFAMLQFPIYCLPAILKLVYDRLLPVPGR